MNNETHISPFLINYQNYTPSKKHNGSINTQNQDQKFLRFLSQYIRMKISLRLKKGSKKYHIKVKFSKFDVYLIIYCKKGGK